MRKVISLWIMFFILLFLPFGETKAAPTLKLNKTSMTIIVGKTKKLEVKNTKKTVKWSSSNKSIASVSSKGIVKGIKPGTAKIRAKVSGKTLTCTVKVKNADANIEKLKFRNTTGGDFVEGASKATVSFMPDNTSTNVQLIFKNAGGSTVYKKVYSKVKANHVYEFQWNGKNSKGKYVSKGNYTVTVLAGSKKKTSTALYFYRATDFAGGDGSKKNPYKVSNLKQLNNIRRYNGRHFKQVANIDGDNANFTPLFTKDNLFTGTYNGGNKTISNLYIRANGDAGIFVGIAEKGEVRNLKVTNLTFPFVNKNDMDRGSIAGYCQGNIYNCTAKKISITGGKNIGGICGGSNSGTIEGCTVSDLKLTKAGYGAGGICGRKGGGYIKDCHSKNVTLTTFFSCGGICGSGDDGGAIGFGASVISNCSLSGKCQLDSNYYVGAIIGDKCDGEIKDCYTDTEYELYGD